MIFLDSSYDPGLKSLGSLARGADEWLHTGTLGQLLNSITNPSPVLDVLRPVIADTDEVQEKAPVWAKKFNPIARADLCQLTSSSTTNLGTSRHSKAHAS